MKRQPHVHGACSGACLARRRAPRAAETCYQDDTRPHRQAAPARATPKCRVPTEGAQPGETPSASTECAAAAKTPGRAPRRRVIERAPTAYVSPIPRPALADYVDVRAGARSLAHRRRARLQGPLVRPVQPQRAEGRPAGARRRLVLQSRRHLRHRLRAARGADAGRRQLDRAARRHRRVRQRRSDGPRSRTSRLEFVYYKGDTVFKPPDYEFRFTPVFNCNYVELDEGARRERRSARGRDARRSSSSACRRRSSTSTCATSPTRYDFDSIRVGIQPFSSDFRGFLFQDNQLGVRLFGTRDNNRWQYNLAYFRRLEKDTNSGLNDLGQGAARRRRVRREPVPAGLPGASASPRR